MTFMATHASLKYPGFNSASDLASSMQLRKLPAVMKVVQWKLFKQKPARISEPRRVTVVAFTTSRSRIRKHTVSTWAISLCDHLEKKVMSWAAGGDDIDDKEACYLLLENYAPVSEMAPTTDLSITGSIPACMNGEFLRIGPNPKFVPVGGYHW